MLLSAVALGNPGVLFTYEGVLTDTSGTPIVTTQTVTLQILHNSSCVVYSETHDVLPGSSGEFSVQVGTGTRLDTTGNSADRIFASSGTVGCQGAASVSLSGFSPRTLRVQIGSVVLSPDVVVGNVPVAINSQKLADKGPESFIQVSSEITQSKVENILSRHSVLDWLLGMLPMQTPSAGQVLMAQGGQYKPGNIVAGTNVTVTRSGADLVIAAGGGGGIGSVTANPPLVAAGTDAVSLSLPMAGAASDGYLSATDWNVFAGKLGSELASGKILVGSSGGVASPVALSGDATITNTGVLSLSSVGTSGSYYKVTTDIKGRVTSGVSSLTSADIPGLDWSKITSGRPTTLSGYGISNAVANAAGVPSLQSGTDAGRPAAGTAGRLYISTDTKKIYRDSGATWDQLSESGGGTVTSVTAGTGLTGGTITSSGTISLSNTGVTAGSYTRPNISVDAQGRLVSVSAGAPISLSAEVSGVLSIANGGTGQTSASAAFNSLSPMTTKGDLVVRDGTGSVRLPVGSNGQVLTANSAQATGLQWVTPNNGTVTNVTGAAPVVVTSGTTTPSISVSDATTSTKGVVQVGAGLTVATGTISVAPANFPSAVPVAKGGTGATALTANRVLASNATGSAVVASSIAVSGSDLDVSGGTVTMGYEQVNLVCAAAMTCTVTCSAGAYVVGGGCLLASATNRLVGTHPASTTQWKCTATNSDSITAYAICANMR